MNYMLEILSILLECIIVILALLIAYKHKRPYGCTLALTFGLYVAFDAARRFQLGVSAELLNLLFFVASLSALWSVWSIYQEGKGKR